MDVSDLKIKIDSILSATNFENATDTEAIINIVYQLMQYAHSSCNFLKEEKLLEGLDETRKNNLFKTLYTKNMGGILYYFILMTAQIEKICSSKQQKVQEYQNRISELEKVISNNTDIDLLLEEAKRTYAERSKQVDYITDKQNEIKKISQQLEQVEALIKPILANDGCDINVEVKVLNESVLEMQARWKALIEELRSAKDNGDEQVEKMCRLKKELMLINVLDADVLINVIDMLTIGERLECMDEQRYAEYINRLNMKMTQARNSMTELEEIISEIVKMNQIKNDYKNN